MRPSATSSRWNKTTTMRRTLFQGRRCPPAACPRRDFLSWFGTGLIKDRLSFFSLELYVKSETRLQRLSSWEMVWGMHVVPGTAKKGGGRPWPKTTRRSSTYNKFCVHRGVQSWFYRWHARLRRRLRLSTPYDIALVMRTAGPILVILLSRS